ncbi:Dehydrogenase/reductase SDR family member 12 [Strongyloides ratti]|uniref:Dehydrogenase/reductase SDR family member 12 n=1 Tax=Strongyloides ratti TaxID=34506 RepID=A0A090LMV2_STRRB|nr:Dehydrogenase/reductase SDR family member 12 [Strongyloides ratti]CEF71165.1 Dehydrogenase/reductase SDR family member 12 [Strongyloides ratti]
MTIDRNAYNYFKTEIPQLPLDMKFDLGGKVVVITGASSGIGLAFSEMLYSRNATVIMIVRNVKKAKKCVENIKKKFKNSEGDLLIFEGDLSSYSSIIRVVFQILKGCKKIDLLVNNAGIGALKEKSVTIKEGTELVMASNYFGHFLLTINLLPLLRYSKGKVISITSFAYDMYDLDDDFCQRKKKYNGWKAYSNSKACQIIMTNKLSQLIHFTECSFIAVSPGIVNTPISETFSNNLMGKSINFVLAPIKNFFCKTFLLSPEKACDQIMSLAFFAPKKIFHGAYVSQRRIIQTNFKKKLENKIWIETFRELLMNTQIESRRLLRGPMTNDESILFIKRHPEIYLAYLEVDDLNFWEKTVILPNEEDLFIWLNESTDEQYLKEFEYTESNDEFNDTNSNYSSLESEWDNNYENIYDSLNLYNYPMNIEYYLKDCSEINSNSKFNEENKNHFIENTSNAIIEQTKNNDTLSKNGNKNACLMENEIKLNSQQSNNNIKSFDSTSSTEFDANNDVTRDEIKEFNNKKYFLNNTKDDTYEELINKRQNNGFKKSFKKRGSFIKRLIGNKKELMKETDRCIDNIECDVIKSSDDHINDIILNDNDGLSWSESLNGNVLNIDSSSFIENANFNEQEHSKREHLNEEVISNYDNSKITTDNVILNKKNEDRVLLNSLKRYSSSHKMVSDKKKNLINNNILTNLNEIDDCKISNGSFEYSLKNFYNINTNNKKEIKFYKKLCRDGIYTEDNFNKFFIINFKNKIFDFIKSAIETITVENINDFVTMERILRKNGFRYNVTSLNENICGVNERSGNILLSMIFKNYHEKIKNISNKHIYDNKFPSTVNNLKDIEEDKALNTLPSEPELIVYLNLDDDEGLNLGYCDSFSPNGIEYEYEDISSGNCYVRKTDENDSIYKAKYDMKLFLIYKVYKKIPLNKKFDSKKNTSQNGNEYEGDKKIKLQERNNEVNNFEDGILEWMNTADYKNKYLFNDEDEHLTDKEEDEFLKMIKNKKEDIGITKYNITEAGKEEDIKRKKRISFKDNILKKSNFIASIYNFHKKNNDNGKIYIENI